MFGSEQCVYLGYHRETVFKARVHGGKPAGVTRKRRSGNAKESDSRD
jgi:hypothetical protein